MKTMLAGSLCHEDRNPVHADLSALRFSAGRNHAYRRLYLFLAMPTVQGTAEAEGGGLLRILLLRHGTLSTDPTPAQASLLRNGRGNVALIQVKMAEKAETKLDSL